MITKFNIFEKLFLSEIDIKGKLSEELKEKIIQGFSMILSKRKKRNVQVISINYKSKEEKFDKKDFLSINTLKIILSNKDIIEGILSQKTEDLKFIGTDITIKINDKIVIDIESDEKMEDDILIEKMTKEYRKYLEKNWKIS